MKERLCLEVERLGLSAVIMGSRGFGASGRTSKGQRLGSVSDYRVHHCVCPVVVVRYPDDKDGGTAVGSPLRVSDKNGGSEGLLHPVPEEEPEFHDASDVQTVMNYALDIKLDRVEDVLLHQKLLVLAMDPKNRHVFHIRLLENFWTRADIDDCEEQGSTEVLGPTHVSDVNQDVGFEPCSQLEDLNLEVRSFVDTEGEDVGESSRRKETDFLCTSLYPYIVTYIVSHSDVPEMPIHEVIFSAIDKPKLLSQLPALLSDIDLNIREAHVFSTIDGYSLDVFVVYGWPFQETDTLHEAMEKAISRSESSWSGSSSHSISAVQKALATQPDFTDAEIDRTSLKIGERLASGSCGDSYRGEYLGQDVAVKILSSEHLNETVEDLLMK